MNFLSQITYQGFILKTFHPQYWGNYVIDELSAPINIKQCYVQIMYNGQLITCKIHVQCHMYNGQLIIHKIYYQTVLCTDNVLSTP